MASYDVFIKGVRPEKLGELEQLKQKISLQLKVDVGEIEKGWNTPGGFCIRRQASGDEATQLQTTYTQAGFVCLYRPASSGPKLSLVDIEHKLERKFVCPYCQYRKILADGEEDPVQCPECMGVIAKYAETQEIKNIRNRLLKSKENQQKQKQEEKRQEEERLRKEKLEQKIAEDLFGKTTKLPNRLIIAASVAATVTIAGGIYLFVGDKQDLSAQPTLEASELQTDVKQETHISNAQEALQDTHDRANKVLNASGLDADNLANSGQTHINNAQEALENTHDRANKVLNSFGLDADNLANSGQTHINNAQEALENTHDRANKVLNASGLDADNLAKGVGKSTVKGSHDLASQVKRGAKQSSLLTNATSLGGVPITPSLLENGDTNQEWDLWIQQRINSLLQSNDLNNAYRLSQSLIDTELYIDTMGLVLKYAQQSRQQALTKRIIKALEQRIDRQVSYLARAGFYQWTYSKSNSLLKRAEVLEAQITDLNERLDAMLNIAIYNFKIGNSSTANNYFQLAETLLEKITSNDSQISARAAIGQAYSDVNQNNNALKWLASAGRRVAQANDTALKALIKGYIHIHDLPRALSYIPKEQEGAWLYYVVQETLNNKLLDGAWDISRKIQDPAYRALATDLVASYDQSNSSLFLNLAEMQVSLISLVGDKVIVVSHLASHYARLGNIQKQQKLMADLNELLGSLPTSKEKDKLLSVVVANLSQALLFAAADKLTHSFSSQTAQLSAQKKISYIKTVSDIN